MATKRKQKKINWRDVVSRRMVELDLNQSELARILDVGRSTVGHWLTGHREPRNIQDFERLAKALHLDPSALISEHKAKETIDILKKEELKLLEDYRRLSSTDKITIKRMLESLPKTRKS